MVRCRRPASPPARWSTSLISDTKLSQPNRSKSTSTIIRASRITPPAELCATTTHNIRPRIPEPPPMDSPTNIAAIETTGMGWDEPFERVRFIIKPYGRYLHRYMRWSSTTGFISQAGESTPPTKTLFLPFRPLLLTPQHPPNLQHSVRPR